MWLAVGATTYIVIGVLRQECHMPKVVMDYSMCKSYTSPYFVVELFQPLESFFEVRSQAAPKTLNTALEVDMS